MAEISAKMVKDLRESTGAGMMDCKQALNEASGDFDKAVTWLREKGMASAAKRADRDAGEGAVFSYIHLGGKIGVMVEVNCETDFVARGEKFQQFGKDVCMHISFADPKWLRREDVPADAIAAEKDIYVKQAAESGKPANICEKIAEGKMKSWFEQVCLLEQPFIKDKDRSIESIMQELSGLLGEKIQIRRFARFLLGEAL
ncbi:MAG TPA: translation elongation factor Ts [Candidatus Hydrogenedentes bacterium]|nr:translation elongation factor Ts [Candidatus Hydrogenedentota bacterium]